MPTIGCGRTYDINYEGIEYVIRAGLGRNEWTIVISFPDASEPLTRSSVISLQGTREEANVNCDQAIPYPPDGQTREWWQRLKNALGTSSSAFVAASLQQLIAAARLPNSGICEIAVNASLAFIEGAKPRDEIECALVIQMACTHSVWRCLTGLGEAAAAIELLRRWRPRRHACCAPTPPRSKRYGA